MNGKQTHIIDALAARIADRLTAGPQLTETDQALMQPWFLPQKIAHAIMTLLSVPHRRKWAFYFEDYGCLRCNRKDVAHQSNGLCNACRSLVDGRLKSSLNRHAGDFAQPEEQIAQLDAGMRTATALLAPVRPMLKGSHHGKRSRPPLPPKGDTP